MSTTLIDGIFLELEADPNITNLFELAISRWDLFLTIQNHKLDLIFLDLLEGPGKAITLRSFVSKYWTDEQKSLIYEMHFYPDKKSFSAKIPSKGLLQKLTPLRVFRELRASKVKTWKKESLKTILNQVYPLTRRTLREHISKLEPDYRIHAATILRNSKHSFPISRNLNEYRRIPRNELIQLIYSSGVRAADMPEDTVMFLRKEKNITIYEYSHLELDYPLTPGCFPYVTYSEAQALVKNQYSSLKSFNESYKSRGVLKIVPCVADILYKENWVSWNHFLGLQPAVKKVQKQWLTYEDASRLVREANIKSREEFIEAYQNGTISRDIPPCPHRKYRGTWINWHHFFGTTKEKKAREARPVQQSLPFEEAMFITRSLGLSTRKDFYDARRKGFLPKAVPRDPKKIYEARWISWLDFLGVEIKTYRKGCLPFEETKKLVREANLKSRKDYLQARANGIIPTDTPSHPAVTYKTYWISWNDFLDIQKVKTGSWLDFKEARQLVHDLKLNSRSEFWKALQSGALPRTIPSQPDLKYKREWKGWKDFVNYQILVKEIFLSFEEAKDLIAPFKLKSRKEFYKWLKASSHKIPYTPEKVYKSDWKGWTDFLSRESKEEFLSFEESKDIVQKLGLKNRQEFWKLRNTSNLNIPSDPTTHYRSVWRGWDYFLKGREKTTFFNFEEARKFVQSLGLRTREQFKKHCKSGLMPVNIPRNPARTYVDNWTGWQDFLGK